MSIKPYIRKPPTRMISYPSYRPIKPADSHYRYYYKIKDKPYSGIKGSRTFEISNQYKMMADRMKYLNLHKASQRLKSRYRSRSLSRSPPPHPYSPRTRRTSRSPSPKTPIPKYLRNNRFYNYYNIKKYRPSRRYFETFRKYKRKKRIKNKMY